MEDAQFFELCGKITVGALGCCAAALLLGFSLWACGWGFVLMIQSAMKSFGFWRAFLQMKQTHRAFAVWAAEVCREDRVIHDGFTGKDSTAEKLRAFMAYYDPENDYNWKQPPTLDEIHAMELAPPNGMTPEGYLANIRGEE